MRITADIDKCQGYGNCVVQDEKHFDLDDDGLVTVLDESVEAGEREQVEAAIRSCPVAAIGLVDEPA